MGDALAEMTKGAIANMCGASVSGFLAKKAKLTDSFKEAANAGKLSLYKTGIAFRGEQVNDTPINIVDNDSLVKEIFDRIQNENNDNYFNKDYQEKLTIILPVKNWKIFEINEYNQFIEDLEKAANAGLCTVATVGAIENYTESTIKEMCNTFDKATIPVDSQELLGTQSAVGLGTVWGSNIAVNYLSRSVVLKESSKIGSTVTRVVDIKLPKSITEADSNLLTLNSLREKTDSDIVFHSRTKKELKQQEAILRAERMSVEEQVGIILGRNRVLTLMADHAESRRQRIENNEIIRNLRKPQSEKEDEVNEQIKAVDLVLESHFDILGLIVLKIGINNKFKMQDRSLLQRGFDAVTTPYTTASKFASNVSSSNPFDFFGTNKSGGKTRKNKNKNKRNSRRRHKNKRNSKRRTRK